MKYISIKMDIPNEHRLICEGCGKTLDMRDAYVLCHGWIENGEVVCYDNEISYSSSMKKGEPILYTKDKKSINLN